jgi:hypothetical protein
MSVKASAVASARDFISKLSRDYPDFKFKPGDQDHWSPKSQTITYSKAEPLEKMCCGILHELAHAVLDHTSYNSDFELVKLESEAWNLAAEIGHNYGVEIDDEHIQNCLDTYRDWLHRRSACPRCGTHVLQKDVKHYQCYNCQATWQVSAGRFVRPYRLSVKP